ncbi:MAG: ABC transporter substrate-binding protein [Okeania sp. SIO3B5]|uniref:ABC transporter substrate-binding protein n=1 Tax=Okeania sp. SIO3B5 TaxID=2607811 RepID=UPI001400B6C0|nr:ABC transporter substrate-binding protein [Okeania sp. SIO3B5]NEO55511.1 ABC transporter substrate-binding protein [Okeania sp. SIO3B5]
MVKQVVIRIEEGSFESGFRVSLKFSEDGQTIAEEFNLQLPPNPDFPRVYDRWKDINARLGEIRAFDSPEAQVTNVSNLDDCKNAAQTLEDNTKNWFSKLEFEAIAGKIIKKLEYGVSHKSLRVIIDTSNDYLSKLSWDSWDLFQEQGFFTTEFALLSKYDRPKKTWQKPIRILAIFGSNEGGLQLEEDRKLIENLKRYGVNIYPVPATGNSLTHQELFDTLWQGNWDIIFYTGHSSGQTIQLDHALTVPVDNLREALRETAPKVKLAIFNSCDGLGIGEYLTDFNIPNMIVMRELVPDRVARSFLQYFLEEFTKRKPLHASVRKARGRLQILEFPDSDGLLYPRASKLPVLIQNPNTPQLYWPGGGIPLIRQIIDVLRKASKILTQPFPNRHFRRGIILFLLTVIVVVGISLHPEPEVIGDNISIGEEILVKLFQPRDKHKGVKAVAKCQKPWYYFLPIWKSHIRQDWSDCFRTKNIYQEAAQELLKSWKTERRDPETLIYLNNAILEATEANFYTIAVVVPVLEDAKLAEEILRGVAQAQTEVNLSVFNENKSSNLTLPGANFLDSKSLNGKGLKVIIANDANLETQAVKVAQTLVKRSDIRGVIASWTSEMTMATVDIYNRNELVSVSPSAATSELTEVLRPFFFRVIATNDLRAEAMVDVLMKKINQNKATIFYNPASPYSSDYKKHFQEKLSEKGGSVIDSFDISRPNFNAKNAIQKVRKYDKSAIVLVPDAQVTNSFDNALKIIRENKGINSIVGDSSIYSPKTLDIGQLQLLEKLIITVNWHRLSSPQPSFPQTAEKLWGGDVSNRTALSYDAAQVLIKGIEENGEKHRREIKKILAGENFRVDGVTGEIKFQPGTSDRKKQPLELVKVVRCPRNKQYGFAFVPVEYQDVESICSVPD